MATASTKSTMIAIWVVGLIAILGIIGWAAGWFGGAQMTPQTGQQTPTAESQPADLPPADSDDTGSSTTAQ